MWPGTTTTAYGLASGKSSARSECLEARVRDHPENAFERSDLGLLYVWLGRKEEAIGECRRAVDLVSANKDATEVPLLTDMLALVYAHTGEIDQAIRLIERLLTTPGAVVTRRTCSQYRHHAHGPAPSLRMRSSAAQRSAFPEGPRRARTKDDSL